MGDNVQHPAHYSGDGLECIDVIEAFLGREGFIAYCEGNVLKYSWRHKQKNGPEDLAKAEVYREWARRGTAAKAAAYEEQAVAKHAAPLIAGITLETDPALLAKLERAQADDPHVGALKAEEAFGGECR
jgi:hypothetical protein